MAGPQNGEEFFQTRFVGCRFTDAPAGTYLMFSGCELVDCEFSGWDMGRVMLSGPLLVDPDSTSTYRGCRFRDVSMRNIYLLGARFEDCLFENVDFDAVHFHRNDLVNNRFVGVVDGLTLWGREPEYPGEPRHRPNEIRGNDFREADWRGSGLLGGVSVEDQLWPERDDIVILDRAPERAAAAIEALESAGAENASLTIATLRAMFANDDAQKSVVLRRHDPAMGPTWDRVVLALMSAPPRR